MQPTKKFYIILIIDTEQERDKYKEELEKVKTLEKGKDHEKVSILVYVQYILLNGH